MQNVEDYQIWFQLGQWYVRNRLKCKKLTDSQWRWFQQ